ncbi:MAG: helix-turn-helix domain-containing protein [Burkholderiaceae bacterium]|nr:helix-turn-helix domain-containing protein [Burkholderiaceae bacterium]
MSKTYTHLSLEERALIQVWLENGLSLRASPQAQARAFDHYPRVCSQPRVPA